MALSNDATNFLTKFSSLPNYKSCSCKSPMEGWAATRRNRPALVVILKLIKRKAFSYFFIFSYILHVSFLRLEVS